MIEELIQNLSTTRVIVALLLIYCLVKLTQHLKKERKIRALGGYAPKVRTYLPLRKYFIAL